MRWVLLLLLASCGSGDRALQDGDRLRLRYWVYEDGTRQWDPTTYFDTKIDAECQPQLWSDGHTYCTPAAPDVAYRDAACTDAVGRIDGEPRAFVRKFTNASERRTSRMYRPTDHRVGIDQYWLFDGAACAGPFDAADATFVDVDEVSAVRMFEGSADADGRVRVMTWSTDDGLVVPARFVDTLADSTCIPSPSADGGLECLPRTVVDTTVFRDATCTQPMATVRDTRNGGAFPLLVQTGCSDYFQRGPEVLNFPAYVNNGAGCVEVELDPYQITYELGDRFPIAQLEHRRVGESRLRPIELVLGDRAFPTKLVYDSMFGVTCEATAGFGTRCMPPMNDGDIRYRYRSATCDGELEPFVIVERTTCMPVQFAIQQRNFKPVIRQVSDPYRGALYMRVEGACVSADFTGDAYASSAIVPLESFAMATRE